jgi:hypothetical protein
VKEHEKAHEWNNKKYDKGPHTDCEWLIHSEKRFCETLPPRLYLGGWNNQVKWVIIEKKEIGCNGSLVRNGVISYTPIKRIRQHSIMNGLSNERRTISKKAFGTIV